MAAATATIQTSLAASYHQDYGFALLVFVGGVALLVAAAAFAGPEARGVNLVSAGGALSDLHPG